MDLSDLLIACTHLRSVTPVAFCGTSEINYLEGLTKSGTKTRTVFAGSGTRRIKKAMNLVPIFLLPAEVALGIARTVCQQQAIGGKSNCY